MPPKKKNNTEPTEVAVTELDTAIENLTINTQTVNGTFLSRSMKGQKLSLNQKRETFIGVGSMWFTPKEYCLTVPDNITPEQDIELQNLVGMGILVLGEVKVEPIDRDPAVLDEYWTLLKTFGLNPADNKSLSVKKFRELFKKPIDRNWTAKEIIKYCMKQESDTKNRKNILNYLDQMYLNIHCPDTLLPKA